MMAQLLPLAADVLQALRVGNHTLALAESCTGGLIAHLLTEIPGASDVLQGDVVAYANAVKISVLGVEEAVLAEHGAVSEAVAAGMATGARARLGASVAVATTGIAGPGGGSPQKPVGTVCLAVASAAGTRAWTCHFPDLSRADFKYAVAQEALEALRAWAAQSA